MTSANQCPIEHRQNLFGATYRIRPNGREWVGDIEDRERHG
jgi:hypothetical protein